MTQTEFIADALARPRDERRTLIVEHFIERCKRDNRRPRWPVREAYMRDSWLLRLPREVAVDLNEDLGGPGSDPIPPDGLCARLRAEFTLESNSPG